MEIILDGTLEPVQPISNYGENEQHKLEGVLEATIPPGKMDEWRGASEGIRPSNTVHTIPESSLYHSSYLAYLSRTYAMHSNIVFKPDMFWYTVLCEIASTVIANPDAYRSVFTSSPEKTDIIVKGDDPFNLPIDLIKEELYALVPVDIDLFLPKFTTTTESSEFAMLASFLETVSPYYSYMMYMCGHPKVQILGTVEDWQLVEEQLWKLVAVLNPIEGWLMKIIALAGEIRQSFDDENVDFWKTIFTEERCGSGGQTHITGWFASMFINPPQGKAFLHNFPTHITRVPYTVLEDKDHRYELCCGMFSSNEVDGFMVPEFSTVVNQYPLT